jgi:hypothetical protein
MFSTAGYFKGLPCPFFLSGLCERPYCHFKHSKPEEGNFSRNKINDFGVLIVKLCVFQVIMPLLVLL